MKAISIYRSSLLAFLFAAFALPAQATLIQGFESGGWEFVGDVSIQNDAIGAPSQGSRQAFITTLCDAEVVGWCETTARELPYTGISALPASEAAQFLGLKLGPTGHFADELPFPPYNGIAGESGALKGRFYASAGSELLFDWRHYAQGGTEGDSSYFTLWSDDPGSEFRVTDYLRYGYEEVTTATNLSSINFCARVIVANPDFCNSNPTYDTGYLTRSVVLPSAGWYGLGFALFEAEEGTVPSALSIDNIRLEARAVPQPSAMAVFCFGLAGLALSRRRLRSGS